MSRAIGIFGGTFDPIHVGHLRSALEVRDALEIDQLFLLPCHIPPHRTTPGANAQQRLDMLRLAVVNSGLEIDCRELTKYKMSYSYDTLSEIRSEIGSTVRLYLIIGYDAFLLFSTWHRWQEILSLAHLVVLMRPENRASFDEINDEVSHLTKEVDMAPNQAKNAALCPDIAELLQRHLVNSATDTYSSVAGKIIRLKLRQLDISASEVRNMIKQGQSPRFLVPEPVLEYMQENSLYQ